MLMKDVKVMSYGNPSAFPPWVNIDDVLWSNQ
jgi:hypothetical protein